MFSIDYNYLLSEKETPAYIKDLIRSIQSHGGTTVGTWLKNVSTVDLMSVMNCSLESVKPLRVGAESDCLVKAYMILIDVLSHAEGLDLSVDVLVRNKRATLLDNYISGELLKRKEIGIVVHYNNLSLNEEIDSEDAKRPVIELVPETATSFLGELGIVPGSLFKDNSDNLKDNPIIANNKPVSSSSLNKDIVNFLKHTAKITKKKNGGEPPLPPEFF